MTTAATGTEGQTGVDQAAADALAAQAAKTGGEGAAKTAEQIAAEASAASTSTGKAGETGKAGGGTVAEVVYALTVPKDGVVDATGVEGVKAFAKANGLSQEVAQKAVDHTNAVLVAERARQAEANLESFQTLVLETWPAEIKADKEFGGEHYDATIVECKRAADKFCTPAEREILNKTGWGNHPLLIRMMARVGRVMADDTIITGGQGGGGEKNAAQIMYGGTQAAK